MKTYVVAIAVAVTLLLLGPVRAQETTVVPVGDFFFCGDSVPIEQCVTTVSAGDTVAWSYEEGTAGHTITACGASCDSPTANPSFDSGRVLAGEVYSFTFQSAGSFLYYCEFHAQAMRGTVVVQPAAPTASPTQAPTPPPSPTPDPTVVSTPTPAPQPTEASSTPTESPTQPATPTETSGVTETPSPTSETDEGGGGDNGALLWIGLGVIGLAVLASGGAAVAYLMRRGSAPGP